MVSKIAVAALVLIVACPILLGYGLNIEYEEKTNYTADRFVDVSSLLRKGTTAYNYVDGDPYAINTPSQFAYMPYYKQQTSTYTGLFFHRTFYSAWSGYVSGNFAEMHMYSFYTNSRYASIVVTDNGVSTTYSDLSSISYNDGSYTDGLVHILHYGDEHTCSPNATFTSYPTGSYVLGGASIVYQLKTEYQDPAVASSNGVFIDLAAGFTFPSKWYASANGMSLPTYASSVTITLDLYTGHDLKLYTTDNDLLIMRHDSVWDILAYTDGTGNYEYVCSLPVYGVDSSCYQFTLTTEGFSIYYVGGWPANIGKAEYYNSYGPFVSENTTTGIDFNSIGFYWLDTGSGSSLPTARIDAALLRSTTYSVIEDAVYSPTSVTSSVNPQTTLEGVYKSGTSISFGGNTYTVSGNNLMVGSEKVPLDGCVFDSVPYGLDYHNRINGEVVSTTSSPSSIGFNGTWSIAKVITASLTENGTTQTHKWVPGKFAWQGVDLNFKLAALLGTLGTMIFIGIYANRTGAKVWPLMLVCAGAGLLFLVMI